MTIKDAYEMSKAKCQIEMGVDGERFAPVLWRCPDTKQIQGPIWISIFRDIAVEITPNGKFRQWMPITTDEYYPYFEEKLPKNDHKDRVLTAIRNLLSSL